MTAVPHRRRGLVPAVLAVLALVLAGCSAGSEPSSPSGAPRVEAEPGTLPVTVPHRYGSTTVEEPPQRIVSVGYTDHDALLALDVVPVATTRWFGDYPGAIGPWAREALGDAERPVALNDQNGIEFERIAQLQPDLIVGLYSDMTQADYDTLSQIAPTVAPPPELPDFGMQWRDVTTTIGTVVGRPEKAQQAIAEVDERLESVRAEHPEFEGAETVVATMFEGYFLYGSEDPRSRLLTDLGFTLPPGIEKLVRDSFGESISRERADVLDTDVVVWLTDEGGREVREDSLYSTLPAAKEKREVFVDNGSDVGTAFSQVSVLSVPYVLDDLVPQLSAAVDGDPETTG